ncbi:MAG TPA: ATP-dependent Clp protease ATP-binding subunit [Roseobacter sp.]|uniref:AAA+ ATPase domain-containing protein n=1 Tax=marine sediment metagenome TaxID=412755 RepID=A0A0F9SA95_9ZZZZ|nr:ATP-dependent Clp protease ATP-binding subunit [Roseobacter sp.]HEC70922.1 ATP-dependent Clp protease ATP-binding subunit [Roseobacter sp.]|tara:strand:+ start:778 stop:1899 length:1122 start_codon:yes stop_codon:yes gene_type:complete
MPFITDRLHAVRRDEQLKSALANENVRDISHDNGAATASFLNSRFSFDMGLVERELRGSIIGQDSAINELLEVLKVVRADIGDPRKPLASLLFCGPTGVGKTETVRIVARALYGDADAMCRIDMNTLAQEHYAASFTGAPPGYVGSKEGTTILDQEKIEGTRNLPGIVLLDELEKASNEVVLALLNVFDNGLLTVASGERTYSFRNSIIFMSSNLGARELMDLDDKRGGLLSILKGKVKDRRTRAHDIVMKSLLERFPPEFVNRIDHVNTFNWIDRKTIPSLVDVELERLNLRLRKHDVVVTLTDPARNLICEMGYDRRFGARGLKRAIRRHLEFPLATFLLEPNTKNGYLDGTGTVRLTAHLRDDRIVFDHA